MILFVFEGKRREPLIFRTLSYLYFKDRECIVCSFGNNIYELYKELKVLGDAGDIVSVLREKTNGKESPFSEDTKTSDFSEVFLFFDYDFHNRNLSLEEMNRQIKDLLEMFDNETGNGKLYINYPMIEAVRYTKALPDKDFYSYTISRNECIRQNFKDLAHSFSDYGSMDFIVLDFRNDETETTQENHVRQNWEWLKIQHCSKANFLCSGSNTMPLKGNLDAISQQRIFDSQLWKHIVPSESVAILCSFPIFLFEYFK